MVSPPNILWAQLVVEFRVVWWAGGVVSGGPLIIHIHLLSLFLRFPGICKGHHVLCVGDVNKL